MYVREKTACGKVTLPLPVSLPSLKVPDVIPLGLPPENQRTTPGPSAYPSLQRPDHSMVSAGCDCGFFTLQPLASSIQSGNGCEACARKTTPPDTTAMRQISFEVVLLMVFPGRLIDSGLSRRRLRLGFSFEDIKAAPPRRMCDVTQRPE